MRRRCSQDFLEKGIESQPPGPLRDLMSTHWFGSELDMITFTLTWRYFVELFVEVHVKGKCQELEAALA